MEVKIWLPMPKAATDNEMYSMMRRLRVFVLAVIVGPVTVIAAPSSLKAQQKQTAPATVISGSDRRWTSTTSLKVVVRDVDQPDSVVSDARVVLEAASARSAPTVYATSDSTGTVALIAADSGDYRVRVLRIGYAPLVLRLRLEVKCQQILEAYVSRGEGIREPPMYTAGKEPKEFRPRSPTGGRGVLTTCATPLPNGRWN